MYKTIGEPACIVLHVDINPHVFNDMANYGQVPLLGGMVQDSASIGVPELKKLFFAKSLGMLLEVRDVATVNSL